MSDPQADNLAQPPDQPSSVAEAKDIPAKRPTNLLASAELSASASSLASVASSKASVATTKSGIRPPSKIGRLCGDKHKPSVPESPPPRSNETDDPLKKMIDEYGRHRLTDVLEEDYEEDQSYRPWNGFINRKRNSSSSPASSLDALWERDSHRLSEAGLSRHSDSSAILTEDTDSFIIGQRVWVGGNKPGHIAFIGETQFAPGEWAGIALDEAIGKNDGSVSGIRYFMCEPKKGVFSRLTRLTRVPLEQPHGGSGDTFSFNIPHNGSVRRSPLSPSPTESHRSILKSPVSISGSNTSLSSAHVDYKIGDRVIIKSGQGSKVGTVRFMGVTEFAPGEWVGVELDEPRGKNDGSVNGIRYFECQANFGLFSPVSKVSKSPSKIKPGQCQVHSPTPGGLPPSGLRRTNSRESMTSNMSMISSASTTARRVRLGVNSLTPKKVVSKTSTTPMPTRTALQDVLKEKQQHIEQLLKERDLERAEITRAASQVDEAEHKLALLRQEYAKYRAECEAQLQEHIVLLSQLKESRNELVTQLDDEKKKNEDWQFKFEEAEITRADLEVSNVTNLSRLKELEENLATEREKVESLEVETNRLFETQENLIKTKEEVENLKKELHETRNKHVAMEGDSATTTVLIKSLQDDLDQTRKDCDEKSEIIEVLKQEISLMRSEQECLKKKVESGETKLVESDEKVTQKLKELEALKLEVENVNRAVAERNKTIEQLQADNLNCEGVLQKDLDKLKMELSAKIADLEALNDKLSTTEISLEDFKSQLVTSCANLETKNQELKEYQNNLGDMESKLKKDLEQLQNELESRIKEQEAMEKDQSEQLSAKEAELAKLQQLNEDNSNKIIELQKENEHLKSTFELGVKELTESHNKAIDELKESATKLSAQNKSLLNEVSLLTAEKAKVSEELSKKLSESEGKVEKLLNDLHTLKTYSEQSSKELETKFNYEIESQNKKISQLTLELQDKANQNSDLIEELTSFKSSLEIKTKENETLISEHEKLKNKLEEELKAKTDDLQKAIEEVTKSNNIVHSLQTELQTTKLDLETASKDLLQYQTNLSDVEAKLKTERDELHESLKLKITEFDNLRKDLSDTVVQKDNELAEVNKQVREQLENVEKLKKDLAQQKEGFEKMMNDVVENQKKELKERDAGLSKSSTEIAMKQEEVMKLNEKISELDIFVADKNMEVENLKSEIQKVTEQNKSDSEAINTLNTEIAKLCTTKTELESRTKKLEELKDTLEKNNNQFALDLATKAKELTETSQKLGAKNTELDNLSLELSCAQTQCEKLSQEVIQYQNNLSDVESNLRQERDAIKGQLELKIDEFNGLTEEISKLKEQLNLKTCENDNVSQEKNKTEAELEARNNELQKIKDELSMLNNNLEGKLSDEGSLKLELDGLKLELSSKTTELQVVKNDLSKVVKDLEEQLSKVNDELAIKTKEINNKGEEIIQITENQKTFINELMSDHKSKLAENSKKIEDWENIAKAKSEELNQLSNSMEQLKTALSTKDEDLAKLNQELTQIKTSNAEISSNVLQKTEAVATLENENQEYKDKLEQLEKQLSQVKSEKEALDSQVQQAATSTSSRLSDLEKTLLEKEGLIQSITKETEMLQADKEKVIKEHIEKLKTAEYSEGLLKNLVAELQNESKEASSLNANFNNLQREVNKRDFAIKVKDSEIANLKDQLTKVQSTAVINESASDNAAKSNGSTVYKKLLEEKIVAENQVAFLNSIIVDMQKKNEEQKARIEILEMGYSPAAAEELKQLGFKTDFERQAAPRAYCDICEEFDLHETEDCPTQASEEPISNAQLGKERKDKPPPRPYCEICGEFGHDTADCTDDQEF